MDAGRFAGIFAQRRTEWSAVSNPGAGNQRFYNYVQYVNMHYYAIGMHYAAIAVNSTQGVKSFRDIFTKSVYWLYIYTPQLKECPSCGWK